MDFTWLLNDVIVCDDVAILADHKAGAQGLPNLRLDRALATIEGTEEIAEGHQIRLILDELPRRDRDDGRNFFANDPGEVAGNLLG
jgi:hypothetical protein